MKHAPHRTLGSPPSAPLLHDTQTFLIVVGLLAVMVFAIILNASDVFSPFR
jgi:hypothetical protein